MKSPNRSWDDEQLAQWAKERSEQWDVEPGYSLLHLERLWEDIGYDSLPSLSGYVPSFSDYDGPFDLDRFHSVFMATRDLLRPWADKQYAPKFLLSLLRRIRCVWREPVDWNEWKREVIACCVLAYDLCYSFDADTSIKSDDHNFTGEKGWRWNSAYEFELDLLDLPEMPPIPTYYPKTGDISEILAFLDVIFEIDPFGDLLNFRLR